MNEMKLLQKHNRTFINWFKETIMSDDNASKTLRLLAIGLNLNVPTWKGYDINNFSFYTKSQDFLHVVSPIQLCGTPSFSRRKSWYS